MAFLTSRTLASGVTSNDLIHIVITGDTSQGNPAGSSYKANMGQVLTYVSQNFSGLTASTINVGGLSANTISASTYYNLPGSSSANCFTDFYVSNLHGCSPITIHDSYQSVGSNSDGLLSRSFGYGNSANGDYSHAEGSGNTTTSNFSHSEGNDNFSGFRSFPVTSVSAGVITISDGIDYSAEFNSSGDVILTITSNPIENLKLSYSSINYSAPNFEIYLVDTTINDGSYVVDMSNLNSLSASTVLGIGAHSEGLNNYAIGDYSHAEGGGNKSYNGDPNYSIGNFSHAEGARTTSIGNFSHSEGCETISSGVSSHAEGNLTQSIGDFSHSEGKLTQSIGDYSHSEGGVVEGSDGPIAYGDFSHAEGVQTESHGTGSHSEGSNTKSYGDYSHSEGLGTITNGDYQLTIGQYNLTASTAGAFIIGNGTDNSNRSNLLVAADEEVTIVGSVGVGTTTIDGSAILQLDSNKKGFLPPRMLGSDAEGITSPAEGLMVYITNGDGVIITTNGWWGFDGTNWVKIGP